MPRPMPASCRSRRPASAIRSSSAGELMNMMAGTNVLHVPYRGAAPSVTDVATGAVTMSFTSLAAAQGLMQAGKIRAVAVTSLERMPQLPDVAPLQEGAPGLKGYELLNWFGLFTTGGTPAAMVERLNAVTVKALAEPKTAETLTAQGIVRAQDHRGAVQGLRRVGEPEVRRHHREGQNQARDLTRPDAQGFCGLPPAAALSAGRPMACMTRGNSAAAIMAWPSPVRWIKSRA